MPELEGDWRFPLRSLSQPLPPPPLLRLLPRQTLVVLGNGDPRTLGGFRLGRRGNDLLQGESLTGGNARAGEQQTGTNTRQSHAVLRKENELYSSIQENTEDGKFVTIPYANGAALFERNLPQRGPTNSSRGLRARKERPSSVSRHQVQGETNAVAASPSAGGLDYRNIS